MALQASVARADRDRMAGAGMRLSPPVKNGSRATLRDMPPIEGAFGTPIAGHGDDQIGRREHIPVLRDELMETPRTMFDGEMRIVGPKSLRQSLGFVPADIRRTKRMTTDVRPAQKLRID